MRGQRSPGPSGSCAEPRGSGPALGRQAHTTHAHTPLTRSEWPSRGGLSEEASSKERQTKVTGALSRCGQSPGAKNGIRQAVAEEQGGALQGASRGL